jgi:hypothetical protein
MASVQNDNAPVRPLQSPPTTADSKPAGRQPEAGANTFSGGAESQVRRGAAPKRRTPVEARKSRYRGVQWDKNGARWRARLHTDRTRHIGYFESEEDAAMAWDLALLRYFGETEGRKKLNFGEASIERYRQEPNAQLQAINSRTAGTKHQFRGPNDKHGNARNPQDPNAPAVPAYRGVVPHEGGLFRSVVMKNRVNVTVGIYATAEEAARAHDCASIQANGWGALTNFPLADYETDPQGRITVHGPINQPINLQKVNLNGSEQQQQQQQQQGSQFLGAGGSALPRSSSWYGVVPTSSTGGPGGNTTSGGLSTLPPLHRQASLPTVIAHPGGGGGGGGGIYATATATALQQQQQQQQQQRVLRSTSLSSAELSMQPSMLAQYTPFNQHQRTGSVTNLHQLAAAAMGGYAPPVQPQQQQQQQPQQMMMTTSGPIPHTPVYLMNQPAGLVQNPFPQVQQQQQQQMLPPLPPSQHHQQHQVEVPAPNSSEQRKRSHAEIGGDPGSNEQQPTTSRSTGGGTGGRPSPFSNNNNIDVGATAGAIAAGGSPDNNNPPSNPSNPSNNTTTGNQGPPSDSLPASLPLDAAVAGVRHVAETGQYQAAIYLDLGTFGSYDEAVRAYDRAALMSSGFSAATHVPLLDAVNRAATAIGGGPPQLLPAGVTGASLRYRGVTLRGGSFLASLDIGGKAYELGPFATELDAAKAFDRYSLLLKGVAAATNFPPWEHLASAAEVGAIIDAVSVVAMTSGDGGKTNNTSGGTAPGQTVNQAPQQQQAQIQQQQQQIGGGGGGGNTLAGGNGALGGLGNLGVINGGLVSGGGSGILTHTNSQAHLSGMQPLPLLSPMIRASSDLERLQSQLSELQAQAMLQQQQMQQHIQQQQQQAQQQQQHQFHQQKQQQQQSPALMFTNPGQATVPLNQVLNNTLPMHRVMSAQTMHMPTHTSGLAAFPSSGNLALPASTPLASLPPPAQHIQRIQQQQQQQQQIAGLQLSTGITPPPSSMNQIHHQQQQPAATTAGSSPPMLVDQQQQHQQQQQPQQHPVSAAVGALAAAAELGQELATAPVSASMPINLPTAAQAAAQSHDQGMLTRTHSMAAIAVAAVANAAATTSAAAAAAMAQGAGGGGAALTQDTTGAAAAAGGAGGTLSTGGQLTPPVSTMEGTLSGPPPQTGDFLNQHQQQQQPSSAPPPLQKTASMAAAEATLAADACDLFLENNK